MRKEDAKWKVCVRCYTFNQATYITDAMNGFTMQQTDFPFICCIVDDASTDGEQEIIKKYMETNFNIDNSIHSYIKKNFGTLIFARHKTNKNCFFAVILLKKNHNGSQELKYRKRSYIAEWEEVCEYEALCEGDDYWIDPNKLQIQADFLESHPEYSMCFHEASILNETSSEFTYPHLENRPYSAKEVFKSWCVPTASILIKRNSLSYPQDKGYINGDIVLILNAAKSGKIWGSSKKMSVYRIQNNGLTLSRLSNPLKHYQKEIKHFKALYKHFPEITKIEYYRKLSNCYINLGVTEIKHKNLKGFAYLGKGFYYSPKVFFKRINNLLKK